MSEILKISLPPWKDTINRRFIPLINNRDRFLIMYGGRGSSKSVCAAKKLIYRCLNEKYFRYILLRKTYNTIKNSQWQTIKDVVEEWGLESMFIFNVSPLTITCYNGNKFIASGCDEISKLKSIKDPTGIWYEEDIIDEGDWITATTCIRTTKAEYLQEIFTINPEVKGKFEDNWFWKRFFMNIPHKSFRHKTTLKVKIEGIEVVHDMHYTAHHSTYKDNRWLPISFKAFLEGMRKTNPYYYTIYCNGEWGNKQSGGVFYKSFDRHRNTERRYEYDPKEPLYISFDFNVRPYVTCTVWQIEHFERLNKRRAIQIAEVLGIEPNNRTRATCQLFARQFDGHMGGLYVYGDPAGVQEDTKTEKGQNDYYIIGKELKSFSPKFRIQKAAPPVIMRGEWINSVFEGADETLEFVIAESCAMTIMDYSYGKEAADGTKLKEKFKDEEDISVERYHHITDANDYLLTEVFRKEFNQYLRGNKKREYLTGESKHNFDYDD